jgi:F-type H+-transporting ATPase subunit b
MASFDGPTLVPDATLLGELAVFLIVLAVVYRYVLPRLHAVIVQRQQRVADHLAAAAAAEERARALEAMASARLQAARKQAREILDNAYQTRDWLVSEGKRKGREEYAWQTRARLETAAPTGPVLEPDFAHS